MLEAVEIMKESNQKVMQSNNPRSKPYNKLQSLNNPEQAAEYLKVVLEEGDKKYIATALRNIAVANNVNLYFF